MAILINNKIAALAAVARAQALVDLVEFDLNENPATKRELEELNLATNTLAMVASTVIQKGLVTQEELDQVFRIMDPENKIVFE